MYTHTHTHIHTYIYSIWMRVYLYITLPILVVFSLLEGSLEFTMLLYMYTYVCWMLYHTCNVWYIFKRFPSRSTRRLCRIPYLHLLNFARPFFTLSEHFGSAILLLVTLWPSSTRFGLSLSPGEFRYSDFSWQRRDTKDSLLIPFGLTHKRLERLLNACVSSLAISSLFGISLCTCVYAIRAPLRRRMERERTYTEGPSDVASTPRGWEMYILRETKKPVDHGCEIHHDRGIQYFYFQVENTEEGRWKYYLLEIFFVI